MTIAVGKLVTSVTSKFGVISRKASMRLATETGCKWSIKVENWAVN